jgi:hypothetical protein
MLRCFIIIIIIIIIMINYYTVVLYSKTHLLNSSNFSGLVAHY